MAKLNEYTDRDLINELTLRGYNLELIFSIEYVEELLGRVNENREVEDRIVLDYDDMDYILSKAVLSYSRHGHIRVTQDIIERILDFN